MDIREMGAEVPNLEGYYLEDMFRLQETLLEDYKKIESLPNWPLNLNVKTNQILLKDFMSRVLEELGETHEYYIKILLEVSKNPNQIDQKSVTDNLYGLNEEIADIWHFLIETFIFSGLTPDLIKADLLKMIKDQNILNAYHNMEESEIDLLGLCFRLAKVENYVCGYGGKKSGYTVNKNTEDNTCKACNQVSITQLRNLQLLSWEFTYIIQLCRAKLKNKAWKQTQVETNTNDYRDKLIKLLRVFMQIVDFLDMDPISTYSVYFKKNHVNRFRIQSKY